MLKNFLVEHWLLILIFTIAFPFRIYHFTFPLLDYHDFRQTQTATVALNFYKHGINFLSSELDIFGTGKERFLLLEFPLYEGIVAFLYKVFFVSDVWGRVVSVFMAYLGAIYLYRLVMLIYKNKAVSILSSFFFLFAPLNIYFQRAFMIESTVISFILAYLFYSCEWIIKKSRRSFLLAVATGILGFISKGSYGPFWMLPIFWFYIQRRGYKINREIIFIFLLPLLALIAWQKYTDYFNSIHGHDYFTSKTVAWRIWNFGTLADRFTWYMWRDRIGNILNMFTKLGLGSSILGLLWLLKYGKSKFLYSWILAVIIYFLTFFRIQSHNYYQMAIIPPVSVAAAFGLWYSAKYLAKIFKSSSGLVRGIFILLVMGFCLLYVDRSWEVARGLFVINWDSAAQLETIRNNTDSKHELIFVLPEYDWSSTLTYYTQRQGQVVGSANLNQKLVGSLVNQNYGSLVLFEPRKYLNIHPDQYTFLSQYSIKFQNKDLIIYKLL